jgi:hypothetical protein
MTSSISQQSDQRRKKTKMINYLENYKLDDTIDKFKVRVLVRGDKQVYSKSEGPVAIDDFVGNSNS